MTRPIFGDDFSRPSGTASVFDLVPALKRRAIIGRPFGAQMQTTYFGSVR